MYKKYVTPYVVKKGDTLTSIAKAHSLSDWREIYGIDDNVKFRKMFPNPDAIDYVLHNPNGSPGKGNVVVFVPKTIQYEPPKEVDLVLPKPTPAPQPTVSTNPSAPAGYSRTSVCVDAEINPIKGEYKVYYPYLHWVVEQTVTLDMTLIGKIKLENEGHIPYITFHNPDSCDVSITVKEEAVAFALFDKLYAEFDLHRMVSVGAALGRIKVHLDWSELPPKLIVDGAPYEVDLGGQTYVVELTSEYSGTPWDRVYTVKFTLSPKQKYATGFGAKSTVTIEQRYQRWVNQLQKSVAVAAATVVGVVLLVTAEFWVPPVALGLSGAGAGMAVPMLMRVRP